MRISEDYEHEPILNYQGGDSCPVNGCNKIGTQCVDVSATLNLTPTATMGTMTVSCQGAPCITCVADPCGASCTVTMTQKVCVSVPIRYGVAMTPGEPTIACTDSCGSCGNC